jgi:hypothetical protein
MKTFPFYGGLSYIDFAFSQSFTDRFHMCRMMRGQNLAEHSARVAQVFRVLLLEYWESRPAAPDISFSMENVVARAPTQAELDTADFDARPFGWDRDAPPPSPSPEHWRQRERDWLELYGLRMALDHDMAETLTGDTPSHSKSPVVKKELSRVEDEVLRMITDYEDYLLHLTDHSDVPIELVGRRLIKLADLAEGLTFSYYNQGLGHNAPDTKSNWVNNNWTRMTYEFISALDESLFSDEFKEWARSFIIDRKLGITPQHA